MKSISKRQQLLFKSASCRNRTLFAALILSVSPFASHAAQSSAALGTGRLLPTAAAIVGLTGLIVGSKALRRIRTGGRGSGAMVGLVAGLISLVIGGMHAANAAGGFGTGNGLAGAIVAIALGLASFVVGAMGLARRSTGRT